ncbi:MAG: PspA/IM30 family protein [Halobacteriovoraceae bacterium]|nr:PspA/IM30 family protein [Halobacteriovoraceae bacterium]
MKNSLFNRVSKIITANVESIISTIEGQNPEGIMLQAEKELESALEEVRAELASVATRKHLAKKQLVEKNNSHEGLTSKIELALSEKREDLAKVAINEQLDIEAQIPIIEQTLHECQLEEKELEGYIQALKAKMKEMEQDHQNLKDVKHEVSSTGGDNQNILSDTQSKVESAEKTFDRVYSQAAGIKNTSKTDIENKAKLQELENLERENKINERLTALKGDS